jgi:hypothetical protein
MPEHRRAGEPPPSGEKEESYTEDSPSVMDD